MTLFQNLGKLHTTYVTHTYKVSEMFGLQKINQVMKNFF